MGVQCDDLRQCDFGGFPPYSAPELGRLDLVWIGPSVQHSRLVDFWTKLGPGTQWVFNSHPGWCTSIGLCFTPLPVSTMLADHVAAGRGHCHRSMGHQKFDPVLRADGILFPTMERWGARSSWSEVHRARAG